MGHTMGVSTMIGAEGSLTKGAIIAEAKYTAQVEITKSFDLSWGSSNTWEQESETVFEQSVTEETTYKATFPVAMGKTISMCQPQGWVGNFKVYSSFFKAVEGTSCN